MSETKAIIKESPQETSNATISYKARSKIAKDARKAILDRVTSSLKALENPNTKGYRYALRMSRVST